MRQCACVQYIGAMSDPEGERHWWRVFDAINKLLREYGHPWHDERAAKWTGSRRPTIDVPVAWMWRLRRAAAYAMDGATLLPMLDANDAGNDDEILGDELSVFRSHLISLSGEQGVYVPIPFAAPISIPRGSIIPGEYLVSSPLLARELESIAPLIGIEMREGVITDALFASILEENPFAVAHGPERRAWLMMHDGARRSIDGRSALVMC